MAEKQISILLVAKNLASGAIGKVTKDVTTLGKVSNRAGQGMRSLAGNLAKLGAIAAVGIGVAVKGGLESLAELESAVSSVDGAIKQLGLTGKVTGAQVATWANEIEGASDAAFDDKAITAGAGSLIRYGKVTKDNLRPAMVVMTDLAAKTGDVESAAKTLAKALADPAKATGVLKKSGVVLTEAQQKQLKGLTSLTKGEAEHYKELRKTDKGAAERYKAKALAAKQDKAQAWLLAQITKTTKGAAEALNGPYKDALNESADAVEDAQRALAEGFMPVIAKAANWIKTKLADPAVITGLKDLGNSLAGMLDTGLNFAMGIPWDKVKSTMQTVGGMAKMALDAFLAMPAWVQTAVVGGWGLNKLTGGALGDIVGELGKGLIKGVLGMNAAVVNINAGVVNGGGGGLPGKGGGVGDVAGTVAKGGALATAGAAGVVTAGALAGMYALLYGLPAIAAAQPGFKPEKGVNAESARDPGFQANRQIAALLAGVPKIASNTAQSLTGDRSTRSQLTGVKSAALESARAIRAKKWDVDVGVKVTVPVRTTVSVRQFNIVAKTQGAYQGSAMIRVRGAG
jgi:hypothetical protein